MAQGNNKMVLNPWAGGFPALEDYIKATNSVHHFQQALDDGPDTEQPRFDRAGAMIGSIMMLNNPPQSRSPITQKYVFVNYTVRLRMCPSTLTLYNMLQAVLPPAVPWQPDPNSIFSHPTHRHMQEEYFWGVVKDFNAMDITTSSLKDMQLCLRKLSQWFLELSQNCLFAELPDGDESFCELQLFM
jgi:hypothetical protein